MRRFAKLSFTFGAHEMEPAVVGWTRNQNSLHFQVAAHCDLFIEPFRENIYHQHKLEPVSIARFRILTHQIGRRKSEATVRLMNGQGFFRCQSQVELFAMRFHLITIFFLHIADVWTFTIIYQRPTTRRKAFFSYFFSFFIQLLPQGEGPLKMDTPSIIHV